MDFEKIELAHGRAVHGRAVLYRGDSLELLKAGLLKCDAIVTDPPYGIGYHHAGGGEGKFVRKPTLAASSVTMRRLTLRHGLRTRATRLRWFSLGPITSKPGCRMAGASSAGTKAVAKGPQRPSLTPSLRGQTGATRAAFLGIFGWAR